MPDKYHYGFDLGNGKDESCLTIFRDEEGDTQVVEAVLYGKQAESVLACLRSRDEQHRREVEELRVAMTTELMTFNNTHQLSEIREPKNFGASYGRIKAIQTFDEARASQLGRIAEDGSINFNGFPVITDPTLKPGEWRLEPGKPMRSNPPGELGRKEENGV